MMNKIRVFKDTKKRANEFALYTAPDGTRYPNVPRDLLEWADLPEPPEDYSELTHEKREIDDSPYVEYKRKSDEQIAEAVLAKAKVVRQAEVDAITVTVGEKVFDGDERSQDRMSRAINAMDDTDQTLWVLADNTPTMVTKAELRSALRLAGEAQTAIWIKPYQ